MKDGTTHQSDTRTPADSSSEAVEAVAFLARSEHRVHVLELLAERPRSRNELTTETEVTRVTLSRILNDLTDRGWIDRRRPDGEYVLTDLGRIVYEDFDRLLGTVSVGQMRPEAVNRLPTDWFGFDLRCLAGSELVTSDDADPFSGARVIADAVGRAETVRAVVGTFTSLPMHTHAEALREDDTPDVQVVFDERATAVSLDEPDITRRWQEIEAASSTPVFHSLNERVPCNVDLVDGERVFLSVGTGGGFTVVESEHPAVVDWARNLFARKRSAAVPLERRSSDAATPVSDA